MYLRFALQKFFLTRFYMFFQAEDPFECVSVNKQSIARTEMGFKFLLEFCAKGFLRQGLPPDSQQCFAHGTESPVLLV